MANYRDRSYYDLAQNTNTHTRLQTGLAAGSLLASSIVALQTGRARKEAQSHAERLEASVAQSSAALSAQMEQQADEAARREYSMWVSSTRNGEIFHTVYSPLARKQIAAVAHIDGVWRNAVQDSVSQAVAELGADDQAGLSRNGVFTPEPNERYLPDPPEPKLPKELGTYLLVIQGFLLSMVLAVPLFFLVTLLSMIGQSVSFAGFILMEVLVVAFIIFYVVKRKRVRKRKIERLQSQHEEQVEQVRAYNKAVWTQWKDENNKRYDSVVSELRNRLGFNPLDDSVGQVWWSGVDPHPTCEQLSSFVANGYRTHPLPDSYISLLACPVVRDCRGTVLEEPSRVLQEEIINLGIWREQVGKQAPGSIDQKELSN